jgi:hypothetical protein
MPRKLLRPVSQPQGGVSRTPSALLPPPPAAAQGPASPRAHLHVRPHGQLLEARRIKVGDPVHHLVSHAAELEGGGGLRMAVSCARGSDGVQGGCWEGRERRGAGAAAGQRPRRRPASPPRGPQRAGSPAWRGCLGRRGCRRGRRRWRRAPAPRRAVARRRARAAGAARPRTRGAPGRPLRAVPCGTRRAAPQAALVGARGGPGAGAGLDRTRRLGRWMKGALVCAMVS